MEDTSRVLDPTEGRVRCGPGTRTKRRSGTARGRPVARTSLAEFAERGENMPRLTFPAHKRLLRKSDFDAAYARGRRFGNGFFAVTASSNEQHGARLGMAVAVRTAGSAVERNRIRRIVRESFRLHQLTLPAVDLVVSAKPAARAAPAGQLRASLAELWKKVIEQGPSGGRGSG